MLFPPDFLTRLEYLSIISKRVFRGSLLAQRRTMQRGAGIEFSDHREYAAGDDFRYLDWNVYARHGDLLLKRFQEEQDLHVYFLLDCSKSMGYGSKTDGYGSKSQGYGSKSDGYGAGANGRQRPTKFDLARLLTAALAYIALADLDRTAVLAFADGVFSEFPLTRGKARILPLMKFLEGLEVSGDDTNLTKAARELIHRGGRTGLAVVISDLFDERGFQPGLDQLRYRRFDGHVLQLHDPKEADPGLLGDVELVDVETNAARKVTVTERNVRTYKRLFAEHQAAVRDYCRNNGFACTQTDSTVRFDELILKMMRVAGQVG